MKIARFLFVMLALAVLMVTSSQAAEPPAPPAARTPRENHPATARPGEPWREGQEKTNRIAPKNTAPGPLHLQTTRSWANEPFPGAVKKNGIIAHNAWTLNKLQSSHKPSVKVPENNSKLAPGPSAIHSRSANQAILGGLTTSTAKYSAAALNGSTLKRKP